MSLINWKPKSYDLLKEFGDVDDRLFGLTLFPGFDKTFRGHWPALDVEENKTSIVVKADLPGLKQEEVEVNVDEDDVLTIKGERKGEAEAKDKSYHKVERVYGYFERSLRLGIPIDRDNVKASYKNGVLEITLPKIVLSVSREVALWICSGVRFVFIFGGWAAARSSPLNL